MKYNIFSLIIIVLFFTNCYDDKGSNSYHDINTIEIGEFPNFENNITIGDVLDIKPELTFSSGVETENLTYTWTYCGKTRPEWNKKDFHWVTDTIALGQLALRITDPNTGVTYIQSKTYEVYSKFNAYGWIILGDKDQKSYLTFIKESIEENETGEEVWADIVYEDVYKQQNNSENFDKALKCMELIKDYFYINDVGTDVFEKFMNTDAPKELKDVLDKIVIQYAKQNFQSIDKWDKKKIFEMDKKLSRYGYVSFDEYYDRFTNKIVSRIEELRLIEDASIIERVKKDLSNRSRIDVKLLANDYVNEYSSIYINKKVRELILKRNLTESQDNDLIQEIQVYRDCGKIISKKDIKRQKSDDGHIEYFVMIDGKKYTNEHLKKMKYGRKFLDSKRYEVINEEKEDEEQQSNEDVALSVLDGKKQGKLAKFIDFFKKRFSKKKNETIEYKTDSHVEDFRASLKVQSKRTTSKSKQEQSQSRNFIEKDEI